ncbi:SseB family protein [Demequina lutea]|uniref:SseB protein N-terminal domain-containing protein n=1 Tax=Demequina lutea TaxID=431489 RepID=A0A7Y9ZB24_9MICO|nr:SseB family protein [Demequina lutea]NYI42112.1 hypothetical protein [Demequina lutea]
MPRLFRRKAAHTAPETDSTPDVSADEVSADDVPVDAGDLPATEAEVAPADIDVTSDSSIVPENLDDLSKAQVVEAIIASGRQDQESVVALIETLLAAELQVPMGVDADGKPAIGAVMTEVEGVVYVAVFTSMDAAAHVRDIAPEFATMTGKEVIGTLRADLGLVVETGAGKFGLIPPMLASIRETIESREVSLSLERLANRVRSGVASIDDLVAALMEAKVVIPTPDEPKGGGGFTPVIGMVDGIPRLVVATSYEAAARSSDVAQFAMSVKGKHIFAIVKDGVGIQLNTVAGSVDFPPELCAAVIKKYSLDTKSPAATE